MASFCIYCKLSLWCLINKRVTQYPSYRLQQNEGKLLWWNNEWFSHDAQNKLMVFWSQQSHLHHNRELVWLSCTDETSCWKNSHVVFPSQSSRGLQCYLVVLCVSLSFLETLLSASSCKPMGSLFCGRRYAFTHFQIILCAFVFVDISWSAKRDKVGLAPPPFFFSFVTVPHLTPFLCKGLGLQAFLVAVLSSLFFFYKVWKMWFKICDLCSQNESEC